MLGLVFLETLVTVAHPRTFTLSLLPPNASLLCLHPLCVLRLWHGLWHVRALHSKPAFHYLFWSPTSSFSSAPASLLDSRTSHLLTTPTSSCTGAVPLPAEPLPLSSSHIIVGFIFTNASSAICLPQKPLSPPIPLSLSMSSLIAPGLAFPCPLLLLHLTLWACSPLFHHLHATPSLFPVLPSAPCCDLLHPACSAALRGLLAIVFLQPHLSRSSPSGPSCESLGPGKYMVTGGKRWSHW